MQKLRIFGIILTSIITGLYYASRKALQYYSDSSNGTRTRVFISTDSTRKMFYICPLFTSGLGNHMFQFASSYGIARLKGMQVVIPDNCRLRQIFRLNAVIENKNTVYCKPPVKEFREVFGAAMDENIMTFKVSSNVRLRTYLQSYRYFDSSAFELKKQFSFKKNISNAAMDILKRKLRAIGMSCKWSNDTYIYNAKVICFNIFKERVSLIGAHVRRGDFMKPPQPQNGFQTASREYLQKAIQWFEDRYTKLVFVVASNGMQWTKQNFPRKNDVIYLSDGYPASTDLAILSLCEHFIGTVGTFSWWAGWLAGGNVTYFKWPAKNNSIFRQSFGKNFSDFFYPKWVGL